MPVAGPATNGWDVVVLADGKIIYARVLKQEPGSYVTFQHPDGRQETAAWAQIRSVTIAPPTTPPPPTGAPAPAPMGPTGPQAPGPQPAPGPMFRTTSSRDCANSTDERCRETSQAGVGQGGLGATLSGQSVKRRLEPPPSYDIGLSLEANFAYATSTRDDLDLTMTGGGWLVGMRSIFGSQLPGPEGGSFHGVGLDASLHVQGVSGSVDVAGSSQDFSMTTTTISGQAGYQYLRFGALDESDLTQSGFGLFLGARVGYQFTEVEGADGSSGTAYGPVVTVSLPSYNAGTTSLKRWTASALALYIEDFVIVSVGAGYTW